jgi:predicted secreted hydrolase
VRRESAWAAEDVFLAHFALTDVAGGDHRSLERLSRGAAGLAGAQAEPFRVWLEDWSVEEQPDGRWRLVAAADGVVVELQLDDLKGPVLQGDAGYSRKGPEPGNASVYYSLPRMASEGSITAGGRTLPVTGLSWMDHEYSTSALGPDQAGWDWFSIQLDDGSELMVFQLRREDGSVDAFSSGTLAAADGSTTALGPGDFAIEATGIWRSPRTGARYPSGWIVTVPSAGLRLALEPWLDDQEMETTYTYWEGAVRATGERAGAAVAGNGYVELTGYAGSMQGQF